MRNPYIGHENQISGVEEYRLQGGKGEGMHLLEVVNGLGLRLTISADRCADIARLSYQGNNFSYFSPTGYVAPTFYDRMGEGFLNSFTAGFLTTCGLTNAGVACEDKGEQFPLHGRISNMPAEHIYYTVTEEAIHIFATIKDHRIFSRKLTLKREVIVSKIENRITVTDHIENEGDQEGPVCILYHYNLGYPLLSEKAELFINSKETIPRDARAKEGIADCFKMEQPQKGFIEQCYFHSFEGEAIAALYNPDLGSGLAMTFDSTQLQYFTEWKMMGERDYVLGLEPGNTHVMGRDKMRKEQSLTILKPGETTTYTVAFHIVTADLFYQLNSNQRQL